MPLSEYRMTPLSEFRLTPEQKAKKEEERQARRKAEQKLRRDVAITFATPEGKRTLRWIANTLCQFTQHAPVINPQSRDINLNALVHFNATRSVYLNIRDKLPKDILIDVEHDTDPSMEGS